MTAILATPRNMEAMRRAAGEPIAAPGVVAYSPATGQVNSASAGDYWMHGLDEPISDEEGEPMYLARVIPEHYEPIEEVAQ